MKYKIVIIFIVCFTMAAGYFASQAMSSPAGKTFKNIIYAKTAEQDLLLDIYLPKTAAKKDYPLIIWLHPGGWISGSKDETGPSLKMLQHGYAVASVEYRFSSAAKFPAQIQDVKAAVRYLRAHASQYNLDPNRFGVWGASAGGHLAALLGTSSGIKEFDGVGGFKNQPANVQAVCVFYGPTDFNEADILANPGIQHHDYANIAINLIGGPFSMNAEKVKIANPITHISSDDAPFLILHGDQDNLIPISQSQLLDSALQNAGVTVRFITIPGAGHGFGLGPENIPEFKKILAFFDKHLKTN